jgi:chemotaxis protein MotA
MKRFDFGIIFGVALGLGALAFAARLEGVSFRFLWQPSALLVVFGGVAGAVTVRRGARGVLSSLRAALALLRPSSADEHSHMLARLGWLARLAHRDGYHVLEAHAHDTGDPLVARGLTLASELAEPSAVRVALDRALDTEYSAAEADASTLEACGGFAPTFGVLGAVLGLISVLRSLDDPGALGTGVATAFVATLYGVGAANLIFFPIAARLRARLEERTRAREELADALQALAAHESPATLAQRFAHLNADARGENRVRRIAGGVR